MNTTDLTAKETSFDHKAEAARLRAAADNFTDEELWNRWCDVGEWLAEDNPEHFAFLFDRTLEIFADAPPHAKARTANNWAAMGQRLILHSDDSRRQVALVAISTHLMLSGEAERRRRS